MFDKLIESEPAGAEFHGRKRYFMVSSVVMGVLFTTAVVYSLYAAEVSLGSDSFVLSTMLPPVDPPPARPETPQPQPNRSIAALESALPIRRIEMSRTDEPTIVPTTTSVVSNNELARPKGSYEFGKIDSPPSNYNGPSRGNFTGDRESTGEGLGSKGTVAEVTREPEAPPVVKLTPAKPEPPKSLGVVNGRASYLPKPSYPSSALALRIDGKVDVQVLIDEDGKVLSAKAVNGHPLLRNAAVNAALNARFSPTTLSKVPVKVTGVIIYNFTQ